MQVLTPGMGKPKTSMMPTPHALASAQSRLMPGMLSHPLDVNMGMLDSMDTIPAHFGSSGLLGSHMGVQSDELTMDLRRDMLRTR